MNTVKAPTAAKLSRECFAMYEALTTELRRKAQEMYDLECSLIRLHWLGMATPRPDAINRLTYFHNWLTRKTQPNNAPTA